MYLERVELIDFRNFEHAQLELGPGVRVFVGANAQGKTNLLEGIQYLATGNSHRVSADGALVRCGASAAVLRAVARVDVGVGGAGLAGAGHGRRLSVEFELRPGGRARARVNGQPRPRPRDGLGLIRSVLFAPEDLQLVRGDPAERRRFLDDLLAQRRPAHLSVRQDFERVLRQRNTLLRSARGQRSGWPGEATLGTWTDALVRSGAALLAGRLAAVHALTGPTAEAYRYLVPSAGEQAGQVTLAYELSTGRLVRGRTGTSPPAPGELAEELRLGLAAVADAERDRGVTLAGPHRDDLVLGIGDLPAKGYASHGEAWSLALALRLASRELLGEVGEEPVVLLDDVFAELDSRRRERLAARCADFAQVLVSAAVDADVPLTGPRHQVRAGTVTTVPVSPDEIDRPDLAQPTRASADRARAG